MHPEPNKKLVGMLMGKISKLEKRVKELEDKVEHLMPTIELD